MNTGSGAPTQATQSQTVSPAGGSVSTTLGTQTVTVRVPAGALSGPATVTVTVYSSSAAPKALQSGGRKVQSIGAGAVLVVEFSVAVSGATLLKPLQASLTTPNAVSGSIFRLAGFGTSFDDIDTVTWAAGTATSDLNIVYPRMSLATPPGGTVYAFYTEPAANASAAPTPVITVAGTPANPVGMFGNATFTGAEASPNGFPYLDPTFSYALSDATLGKIDPATGVFTAGPLDGSGTVTATDTTAGRGNPKGTGPVSVTSQRPGNKGDAFTFSGTLSSTTQLVNSNPTQPQTDTATIALTSTVTGAQVVATPVPGITTLVHSVESDTYPQFTINTATDSGFGYVTGTSASAPSLVPGSVVILGNDAKDSNGVEYITNYGVLQGNGLLDVLPQRAGPIGPNTAALGYTENDPANFTRSRAVSPDGSYSETGKDSLNRTQTITVNSDLSGQYDLRQINGRRYTMSAPSGSPPRIIVRIFNATGTQLQAFNIPSWIPAALTRPSIETDNDDGVLPFPAACNVPAKYGTSGTRITESLQRADAALGNLETLTTTTYTAPVVGPVCIQMQDSVKTFYDFTGQNGFSLLVGGGTVNIQQTTINETLTLQSASVQSGATTLAKTRATSATSSVLSSPGAMATLSVARARFEHAVRNKLNWMRKQSFDPNFLSNGGMTL